MWKYCKSNRNSIWQLRFLMVFRNLGLMNGELYLELLYLVCSWNKLASDFAWKHDLIFRLIMRHLLFLFTRSALEKLLAHSQWRFLELGFWAGFLFYWKLMWCNGIIFIIFNFSVMLIVNEYFSFLLVFKGPVSLLVTIVRKYFISLQKYYLVGLILLETHYWRILYFCSWVWIST